jgi:DNA repair protein RecO (recombination protein O)
VPAAVHESEALVLRRVEVGDSDLIINLFTRELGRVAAFARGARKSKRRFAGALEPFFTLQVRLEERERRELMTLVEADVIRPRLGLLQDLVRLESAGRAMTWIRDAAPARTPEPAVWALIERALDRLAMSPRAECDKELGETGLALLAAFGWGMDFERCVSCGKPCPETRAAEIDITRGGLVCRECGGARLRLSADTRARFVRAAAGDTDVLAPDDVQLALELIERILTSHAGVG